MDFSLQHDLPGHERDDEWQTMLAHQARLLEAMLSRIADTVATVAVDPEPDQLHRLHTLLHETEHFLTTLAQQNVAFEHEAAPYAVIGAGLRPLPPETAARVHVLDQVNATFHANLTAARRMVAAMAAHRRA